MIYPYIYWFFSLYFLRITLLHSMYSKNEPTFQLNA